MEQNILQLFGQNVRKERILRKLSQAELADKADLHRLFKKSSAAAPLLRNSK
ncbi:MAG: hypothetical protein RLZZ628_1202 [Bacteroidota bacterium]|jgi:transcriptional regulator with XRE-family HTH domain